MSFNFQKQNNAYSNSSGGVQQTGSGYNPPQKQAKKKKNGARKW